MYDTVFLVFQHEIPSELIIMPTPWRLYPQYIEYDRAMIKHCQYIRLKI